MKGGGEGNYKSEGEKRIHGKIKKEN